MMESARPCSVHERLAQATMRGVTTRGSVQPRKCCTETHLVCVLSDFRRH
jgi:hypothetical protein